MYAISAFFVLGLLTSSAHSQGYRNNGKGSDYNGKGSDYNGKGSGYNGEGPGYNGRGSGYNGQGPYGYQRCVGNVPAYQVESSYKTCVVRVSLDNYGNYGNSGHYGNSDSYDNDDDYENNGNYGNSGSYGNNGNYGNSGSYGNKGNYGKSGKYGNYNSRYSTATYAVDPRCPHSFLQKTTDGAYGDEYAVYTYQEVAPGTVFDINVCGLVHASGYGENYGAYGGNGQYAVSDYKPYSSNKPSYNKPSYPSKAPEYAPSSYPSKPYPSKPSAYPTPTPAYPTPTPAYPPYKPVYSGNSGSSEEEEGSYGRPHAKKIY